MSEYSLMVFPSSSLLVYLFIDLLQKEQRAAIGDKIEYEDNGTPMLFNSSSYIKKNTSNNIPTRKSSSSSLSSLSYHHHCS